MAATSLARSPRQLEPATSSPWGPDRKGNSMSTTSRTMAVPRRAAPVKASK